MSGSVQAVGGAQEIAQTSLCSKLYETVGVLTQIAVRVIFVLASILMTAALFPISWHAVVLPWVGFSVAVLAGFFFPHPGRPLGAKFAHPGTLIRPVSAEVTMPAHFTEHAPVGYRREGQNCAFNAAAHGLDSDPQIAQWLRNPIPEDLAGFQNFLREYNPPAGLIERFNEYVGARPGQPIFELFIQFLEQNRPAQNASQAERAAYFNVKDAFRNLRVLHGPVREFYLANDAAALARQTVSAGNSQNLRLAISQLLALIDPENPRRPILPHSNQQTDAVEVMSPILNMLPDRFKLRLQETTHMVNPQLTEPSREIQEGVIPLAIDRNDPAPTLARLFKNYREDENVEPLPRGRVRRKSRDFVEPPPVLRFQIKRFSPEWVTPDATWDEWLLSFFKTPEPKQPQLVTRKNNTPVECPEELLIPLQDGRECRYRLASFLTHHGDDGCGHYTSAEIRDGQRYLEDDAVVTRSETPEHQRRWHDWLLHSYLLVYLPINEPQAVVQ